VYATLLAAGAQEVAPWPTLLGTAQPDDEELTYLGARRPLVEWALRRAVLAQPGIDVRERVQVRGFTGGDGIVDGVRTAEGTLRADLVVDALGRTSPAPDWLAGIGARPPRVERTECGAVYYSRYYRVRSGETLPDGPWFPGPRGLLSYAGFTCVPGDNRTFAVILQIAPEDSALKVLRHTRVFDAAVATLPAVHAWTSCADPITDVLGMGMLHNTFRHYVSPGQAPARGFVPVGDALCHTNPMFAIGLAQSIIHAFALAAALGDHADVQDAVAAYHAAVEPEAAERYALAAACDEARWRLWQGEPIDYAHRSGAYELFALAAGGAAAFVDPEVFRVVARRGGFLDRTAVLNDDVALQERIETLFGDLRAQPRPAAGPSREQLLDVLAAATA
jgi:2-polyprenyl-6-methoxyphenol hydroxylase-like FAD-dependent oxidoreductase